MVSDFTRKLRIIRDYYRKQGFLKLCRFICQNLFAYQKIAVFERDFSDPVEEVHPKIPVNIRLLSKDEGDIDRLVQFWPTSYASPPPGVSIKEMVATRLSVGEECMIAEYEGKIIHMNWIGFQNTHLFNNYVLKRGVSSDEAIGYNIYTVPEYRGNRIMEAVFAEIFKFLKSKGYKRITNYIAFQNRASMKVTYRVYKNKVNTLYKVSILGFGRCFLSNRAVNMQSKSNHVVGVVVTGVNSTNNLGIVRGLGRHRVPIILLDIDQRSMVRYSKYVTKRLSCPGPNKSGDEFIDFVMEFGKQLDEKYVLIATNDLEALLFSKYKDDLEQFYILPLPSFETIQMLVNKKRFYRLLKHMRVPHPKTYFPEDVLELEALGQEIEPPYIIKPAYSHLFGPEFHAKNFLINSPDELSQAIEKLKSKNMEVVVQEIIPGNEIYMFYTYFNKQSEPIAVCGYDKLRQYPPDFGCGSLCKSAWRPTPINIGIKILKAIKYYGMAEPEFKRDPRDGEYKLLEINARTTTQSSLPAECGVDVEYVAFLDAIGQYLKTSAPPTQGVLWIDEISDLKSCLKQVRRRELGVRETFRSLKGKKVYAVAARDDPFPFFVSLSNFVSAGLKYVRPTKKN